jgi:hypothetical protein
MVANMSRAEMHNKRRMISHNRIPVGCSVKQFG